MGAERFYPEERPVRAMTVDAFQLDRHLVTNAGSVAGVLIYENLWAAPFASAARRAGGELIANGRIPMQAIIAAVEADEALETEGV